MRRIPDLISHHNITQQLGDKRWLNVRHRNLWRWGPTGEGNCAGGASCTKPLLMMSIRAGSDLLWKSPTVPEGATSGALFCRNIDHPCIRISAESHKL